MSNSADSKRPPTNEIERELAELDRHRAKLVARLEESRVVPEAAGVSLSPQEKVRLFREVFRGRPDVYAERFVAKKTGKGATCSTSGGRSFRCSSASNRPRWDKSVEEREKGRSQTVSSTSPWCRRWSMRAAERVFRRALGPPLTPSSLLDSVHSGSSRTRWKMPLQATDR